MDEGEPPVAGCTDGTTSGGALTRVCFPAEWNGDLILYAHGYVQPDEPLAIPDNLIGGTPVEDLINALGYAYATTSYRANGLVADLAVDDIVLLEELVRRTVRPDPLRVYIVGVSEGGLVAALAVEGQRRPLHRRARGLRPDRRLRRGRSTTSTTSASSSTTSSPACIPGSPIDPPEEVRAGWTATYAPAVAAALADDPAAALELATVTGIPAEGSIPRSLGEAVVGILWYNVFGTADAQERLGGQPYDNEDRVYQGSSDDAALNAGVARFTADPGRPRGARPLRDQRRSLGADLHPSHHRRPDRPVLPSAALRRQGGGRRGRSELLERIDVERFGHCTFTLDRAPRRLRRARRIGARPPCASA